MTSKQLGATMRAMARVATIVLLAVCIAAVTGCDGAKSEAPGTVTDAAPPLDRTMRTAIYLLRDGKVAPAPS